MKTVLLLIVIALVSPAWAGPSSRFIWLPNRLLDVSGTGGNASAMRCGGYVPAEGITGATQIAWYTTGAAPGGLCGVGIYDAPGTTQIATTGGIDCSGTGAKLATGITAFDLLVGVKYNICLCGNAAFAGAGSYASWTPVVSDIARSYSGKVWRFAANGCDSSGNPPSMTGSLTDTSYAPPVVLIGTGTP